MFLKVEGTNFVKDSTTNALLMTGRTALAENEARKKLSERLNGKNDEINKLKTQVQEMSGDMKEIKELLNALLKQRNE